MEELNEKLSRIKGRLLGLLFGSKKSLNEREIVQEYLDVWEEEKERIIVKALDDLVYKGYINTKIVHGERVFWLSDKGRNFVLNIISNGW
jgi:DNA-binding PadR family transcriptional regulator